MYLAVAILFLTVISGQATIEDDKDLYGKVVVITGGAKGIGFAIVEKYLEHGASVVFIDKDLEEGLKAENTLKYMYGPSKILFIHGDVTTDLDRVWKIIFRKYKYVHVLVNNAGILDENDPIGTINTNTIAPMLWSMKFYDAMRMDRGGNGGTIVNIASVVSYFRDPFFWFYKTSKFGVLGLSLGLGHEYNFKHSGVRVYALCPGFTYTAMTDQQMVVDDQLELFMKFREALPWQSAEEVAQAALTLHRTARTGMSYSVDGGELFVSPDSVNVTMDMLQNFGL